MKPIDFLKSFFYLNYGVYFDVLKKNNFGILGISENNDEYWWNTFLVNKNLSDSKLKEIETLFYPFNRNSCVCLLEDNDYQNINLLKSENYKFVGRDQWMVFTNQPFNHNNFNQVQKVKNINDLQIFLNTYNECYKNGDPQNPYGESGEYLISTKKAWIKNNSNNRFECFIVCNDKQKPVAVATLTNYKGIGYISSVGSLQSVRGQGFGKLASLYCIYKSNQNGNKNHCLITEKDCYAHKFYKRIGFKDQFSTVFYQK